MLNNSFSDLKTKYIKNNYMNKIKYYVPTILASVILLNCSKKNEDSKKISFDEPTTSIHFTSDSCKISNWEIRDFTIAIPKSFKIDKQLTENYISIGRESEYLYFGSAGVDLNLSLASDYSDKKITIEDTEGYSLYFDESREIVDKTIVEVVTNGLINMYLNSTNAKLYSKEPKQKIIINNIPASYSGFTLIGNVNNNEVWSHSATVFIPNPNNISKSLFGVYTTKVENGKIMTAEDFMTTDGYKIMSNINFN